MPTFTTHPQTLRAIQYTGHNFFACFAFMGVDHLNTIPGLSDTSRPAVYFGDRVEQVVASDWIVEAPGGWYRVADGLFRMLCEVKASGDQSPDLA